MSEAKKKVIALVIDTELTNEELETAAVTLTIQPRARNEEDGPRFTTLLGRMAVEEIARNVRVLDSD